MNNKKYLDQEGVKYLWSKIDMQDYPNNETLMAVINAIDETKVDKDKLVQSDWNQNNKNQLDYIKNRTHYYNIYAESNFIENPEAGITLLTDLSSYSVEYTNKYHLSVENLPNVDRAVKPRILYAIVLSSGALYDVEVIIENAIHNAIKIDDVNHYLTLNSSKGIYIYFILDNSTLTEEYSSLFTNNGIYLSLRDEDAAASIKNVTAPLISYNKLKANYLPINVAYKDYVDDSVAAVDVQPDWNQNDTAADSFVKNRTHYDATTQIILLNNQSIDEYFILSTEFSLYATNIGSDITLIENNRYIVYWDSVAYDTVCNITATGNKLYIGNSNYVSMSSVNDDSTPFSIIKFLDTGTVQIITKSNESHTISIIEVNGEIHQLDEKYIPDSIARTEVVSKKVDINQGRTNADKVLITDENGNVTSGYQAWTETNVIDTLIVTDMINVITTRDGAMLANENGDILSF